MKPQAQRGFALITVLFLLMVLTLVAVVALKSTRMELRMASNLNMHAEAIAAAETGRTIGAQLLAALVASNCADWPQALGGSCANEDFSSTTAGLTVFDANGGSGPPLNWLNLRPTDYRDRSFLRRAQFYRNGAVGDQASYAIRAELDIQMVDRRPQSGCELGGSGYEQAQALRCVDTFWLITSRGSDSSARAQFVSQAAYRLSLGGP